MFVLHMLRQSMTIYDILQGHKQIRKCLAPRSVREDFIPKSAKLSRPRLMPASHCSPQAEAVRRLWRLGDVRSSAHVPADIFLHAMLSKCYIQYSTPNTRNRGSCVEVWRQRSFTLGQGSKSKTLPAELQALLPAEQLSAPRTVALRWMLRMTHLLAYICHHLSPLLGLPTMLIYCYVGICWACWRTVEFMSKCSFQSLEYL